MADQDQSKDRNRDQGDGMAELDALLAGAAAAPVEMPDQLMAAILADAARVQAEQQAVAVAVPARRPRLVQLWQAIGGWPGLGGLATACAVGLWIGLAPPQFLPDPVALAADSSAAAAAVPFESYDLAGMLAEDVQ
jgi:hypothetical protein